VRAKPYSYGRRNLILKIDKIIRSKRRTLYLEVDTDARLTVRAPIRCSNITIQNAVEKHEVWIIKRQEYAREHYKLTCGKDFVEGEMFLYLGKPYPLTYADETDVPLTFDGQQFIIGFNFRTEARDIFEKWYRSEVRKIIEKRLSHFSQITGLNYRSIRITGAKRRWGSCSYYDDLNFTWRLVLAPLEVIDSVVVHELVHVKIKGHRNGFWEKVKTFLPDIESRRKWLKENQNLQSL